MSQPPSRRLYRDKLLFALAYGAIAAAVLFAHPFDRAGVADTSSAPIAQAAGY